MKFVRIKLVLTTLAAAVGLVLASAAPASAATVISPQVSCGQHSQAWLKAFGYGILHSDIPNGTLTIPHGVPIYHTGIVAPNTRVQFLYFYPPGNSQAVFYSNFAGKNCVAPHESAVINTDNFAGVTFEVSANYIAWETGQIRSVFLGTLIIT